jgi:tetratricopeptide (TPR) repeat protein
LSYLELLHAQAGHPSLSEIGKALALAPSTLSAFFTGARLIGRGNLELLVEHLDGDVGEAEKLRRRASAAWHDAVPTPAGIVAVPSLAGIVAAPTPAGTVAAATSIAVAAGSTEATSAATSTVTSSTTTAVMSLAMAADQTTAAATTYPVVPPAASGSRLDIVCYTTPTNTLNRPDQLIGRSAMADRVDTLLDSGRRVMLHGMGGAGKTALAATIADRRVTAGRGAYLWLRPGAADDDTVLDGLVGVLATAADRTELAATTGDAYLHAIRGVVERSGVRLWVIDDVWRPQTLHAVLRVIPEPVAVLVTSRLKIDVGELVDVDDLAPADAVTLLSLHARRPPAPAAGVLCRELGYHPYALEIAGRHLRQYDTTPAELSTLLRDRPDALTMPGGFAAQGRESVQRLLDRSYLALDSDDARLALGAIAAFSSGTASVELVSIYLGFDPARTREALNRLVDVSLAKRIPGTSGYSVHDLTFAYARPANGGDVIAAATRFVARHAREYPLLASELSNLLAAAESARTSDPDAFLTIVETLATGGYLDDHGHTLGLLRQVDEAIDLVRDQPPRRHTLLTKRGNAAYNQGEHEQAIGLYVRALDLSPTGQRRVILLSLIGKVLAELGRHDEAEEQFEQAYALATSMGDEHARLRILEQHSVAAFRRGDYERVREVAREGLDLSQRLGERFQEAIFLNNLGTAEFELGVNAAVALHRRAQDVAEDLDNDHLRALTHRTLGADFHALERFEPARAEFAEALQLYEKLGQNTREAKLRVLMRQFGYLPPSCDDRPRAGLPG